MSMKFFPILILSAVILLTPIQLSFADVVEATVPQEVIVTIAPPALPVYIQPEAPAPS